MRKFSVSVIVPVYNERENIIDLVVRIHQALRGYTYEIIFIDDYSQDDTQTVVKSLARSYPISFHLKRGKKGKAYSLVEGMHYAKKEAIAMIDADLQYPPEALPQMLFALKDYDIIVSNRKKYNAPYIRRLMNKAFRWGFGQLLFGFNHDVQSGLKVFKRDVSKLLSFTPSSAWSFDLEFLHRASEAGFTISDVDITFERRRKGASHINFIASSFEVGFNALLLKLKKIPPLTIAGKKNSMVGAGIAYRKHRYITHTNLPYQVTAVQTLTSAQKKVLAATLALIFFSFVFKPLLAAQALIGVLSTIYFLDFIFMLCVILRSLRTPCEIETTEDELKKLSKRSLPMYSILCPLYKEAHIIPQFLSSLTRLDWPKNKLDVLLLLEEDDCESIDSVSRIKLPSYVRTLIVPNTQPKTKPKACNYGLSFAKGEYIVVYDAEDMPDPDQLKKAYLAFQKVDKKVVCLQAKLNYYNPHQNLLTRLFTAEYSLWFDVTLTGYQSIQASIPLGGTSNHFRKRDLIRLAGWDPFNVTEDADLGIRLFRQGYKTAIINSTTFEEANSRWGNWVRQRSRWIKGYMQTYLVHTRNLTELHKEHSLHALIFHLIIGGKIAFILINPLLWLATISYFALYAYVGPTIEALYPSYIFYMAVISLVFGNFLYLYYYMIGCMKKGQWGLIKYTFLVPFYWLMMSIAGSVAIFQLLFRPYYWEKTIHGLHLKEHMKKTIPTVRAKRPMPILLPGFGVQLSQLFSKKRVYITGTLLITTTMLGNFINFIFNSYLGRVLHPEEFGLISLVGSFLALANIPFQALFSAVNYRSSFLIGRWGTESAVSFWRRVRNNSIYIAVGVSLLWILLSPILKQYFHEKDNFPIVIFALVWLTGFTAAVNKGLLSAQLQFGSLSVLTLAEPLVRLITGYLFVKYGIAEFAHLSLSLSTVAVFAGTLIYVHSLKKSKGKVAHEAKKFPVKYFIASILSGLSTASFLSLDIILASHYLSQTDSGKYALVALIGKIVFFFSGLSLQFMTPLVSRQEGENKETQRSFYLILLSSFALSFMGFLSFGVFGSFVTPLLFGERVLPILSYLPLFSFTMLCFSISRVFLFYYTIKKLYTFSVVSFVLAILQYVLISFHHSSILSIVRMMTIVGGLNFVVLVILHMNAKYIRSFENNFKDFLDLFSQKDPVEKKKQQLRILIFNWRDIKHKWSGGAEVYIHELAKRWVDDGIDVTIFSGNSSKNKKYEIIDGITIIRHGGFYTVYFWAFVYYLLKLRGKYDVIIDCENGIPFFTPLYTRKAVFLLIHHVHQEVFREHLRFPFSFIAQVLEKRVMPVVYKNSSIITVSESSKQEIIKHELGKAENIQIIYPGIDSKEFYRSKKTAHPSFVYLGRLKPYKNIDVLIRAFKHIAVKYSTSRLTIVGEGQSMKALKRLTSELHLENSITFTGKVSQAKKAKILSESWAMIQPSMIEGWGITVLEANASGTPVIASNVGGLRDSVINGQTGVLVKPRSTESLLRVMNSFIVHKSYWLVLSRRAYQWSRRFSWDVSAQEFYKTIAGTIQEKGVSIAYDIALVKE